MQGKDYVKNPSFAILSVLGNLANYFRKLYVYPSKAKILELLKEQCNRVISKRTLSRHIGALQRDGWIVRTCRHKQTLSGELECHSNLYVLTAKAVNWMKRLGTKMWRNLDRDAKSLIDIAVTIMADHPPGESKFTTQNPAHAPPRT